MSKDLSTKLQLSRKIFVTGNKTALDIEATVLPVVVSIEFNFRLHLNGCNDTVVERNALALMYSNFFVFLFFSCVGFYVEIDVSNLLS